MEKNDSKSGPGLARGFPVKMTESGQAPYNLRQRIRTPRSPTEKTMRKKKRKRNSTVIPADKTISTGTHSVSRLSYLGWQQLTAVLGTPSVTL
jgi:hypothetical protein